ncbi:hypothetical protein GCM10011339_11990 [Echinicola rosea]|uniref:Fibronectin type-III domain-containing protein n=2 Tax=Echinicola rosea TaxID=1807691 RepID=A0ABQ1UUM2_9BACT|nr:hypothetical protein GCM10011339_11990 [Echinicola rosea]
MSKPGEPVDPVSNLEYTLEEQEVTLAWDLPSSYPADVVQPVMVHISISINGQNAGTQVLDNDPVSFAYPYDPENTYKFIVKVLADIETSDEFESDIRYSLGNTVNF